MIACAAAPPVICSGICFVRPNVSFSSGFSAGLTSAPRKHLPLISTLYPIEKDVSRVPVRAVATTVESDYEVDIWKQHLEDADTLASVFEDASIPEPDASSGAKTFKKEKKPKRLSSSAAQMRKPDLFQVIRYPLGTESAVKAMLEHNTLVFVVHKLADKRSIKGAAEEMFRIRAKKVNTSIMPDGTKKAYIMLAPEFKAVDVAKKIKIL